MPIDEARDARIEAAMLALLTERGPEARIDPVEIARNLGGAHPDGWGPLMKPVRAVAVRLAREGRITVLRKGRPVDPEDFRGVYRLANPSHGSESFGPEGAA